MSESNPAAPAAATFGELKNGLPGASAEFLCVQLDKGATLAHAQQSWMAEQNKLLEASKAEAAAAKAKADEAAKALEAKSSKKPGVEPLGDGKGGAGKGEDSGDAIANWNAGLQAKVERFKGDRSKAASALVKEQPELHRAYLEAVNGGRSAS